MQRFYTRHLRLAAAALIGVIIAGGFWASPSLRALAQEVLAFFTNESSDAQITVQPLDSGVRAAQASANFYSQSIHDVADQIDFTLRVPTTIPGNYQFAGAEYRPDQGLAALRYECDLGFSFVLTEQLSDTPHTPDEVGASAVIEDVPIRETIGQYVRGAWMAVLDEITTTEADKQNNTVTVPRVWTNESDWQQMYWREAGINFMIASGGAGDSINQTPCALTKADYAAIAQGLELMQP